GASSGCTCRIRTTSPERIRTVCGRRAGGEADAVSLGILVLLRADMERRPAPLPRADLLRRRRQHHLRAIARSSSVVPPQIPWACRVRSANERHSRCTRQPAQILFASVACSRLLPVAETGKNNSGSTDRHAAADRQFSVPL